jgi:hypothetical protein
MLVNRAGDTAKLEGWVRELEKRSRSLPRLIWGHLWRLWGVIVDQCATVSDGVHVMNDVTSGVIEECTEPRPMGGVTETRHHMFLLCHTHTYTNTIHHPR